MAMREMIEPRNETGKEGRGAGDGLEKQLPTINKKNWFDGRETPTYYHQDVYISPQPSRDIENRTIFTLSTANA